MGWTSITLTEATRDILRDDKPEGVSWDRYLTDLVDDTEGGESTVSYDDVKAATRAAIREELPVEAMGR